MSKSNVTPVSNTNIMHNDFAGNKHIIDNSELSKDVIPVCGIICGYLVLIMALITWMIASSIALSQSSIAYFREECTNTNIWVSLLVMIIAVGLGMLDNWCGKRNENNERQPNILVVAVGLGSQIFSSIEIFNSCAREQLEQTLVYQLQFWMLIVIYSLYGIIIIAGIVVCCICCREEAAHTASDDDEIESMEGVFANIDRTLKNVKERRPVSGDENV